MTQGDRERLSMVILNILYSLEIIPPLIILLFAKMCCQGIFISNLCPSWPYMEIHNKNGRTLRLRWMRRRLERTVPPYTKSSYLLAGDILTKWLGMWRQAHGGIAKIASFFLTAHTLCLQWFMLLCQQNWATMSFLASHMRRGWTILPLLFPLTCSIVKKGSI